MTAFKVGDVVRFKPGMEDKAGILPAGPHRVHALYPVYPGRPDAGLIRVELDADRGETWNANRLELVSRPPNDKEARQYLARSDSPLDRKIAAGMELKVGDRVRVPNVKVEGRDTGTVRYVAGGEVEVKLDTTWRSRTPLCWRGSAAELELLPPEPAKRQCIMGSYCPDGGPGKCFHPPAGFYDKTPPTQPASQDEVKADEPVTTAETSIQDAMRYLLTPVLTVKPEVLKAMHPESIRPGQVIVYDEEPTLDESGPGIAKPTHTLYRYEELRDAAMRCLEGGVGIAKLNLRAPTKHRERLMTTSWAPYGDWDNLPDAD